MDMHRNRSPRSMPQNRRSNNPFAGGKGRTSRTSMSYSDSRYGKQHGTPHRGGGGGLSLLPTCICALVVLVTYGTYSFAVSAPSTTLTDLAAKQTVVEHKVFDVNNYPLSSPSNAHSHTQLPPLAHTQTGTGIPPPLAGRVGFSPPAVTTGATAATNNAKPGLYPQIHPNIVKQPATQVPPQPRVPPISLSSAAAGTSIPPVTLSVPEVKDPDEDEDEDEEGNSQDGKAPPYRSSVGDQNAERHSEYGEDPDDAAGDSRDSGNYHQNGTEEEENNEDSQDFRDMHQDVAAAATKTKDQSEYAPNDREPPAYDGTSSVGLKDPEVDVDTQELRDSELEHPVFSTAHTGLPPQIQELEDAHHLSQGLDDPVAAGGVAVADLKLVDENQTIVTAKDDAATTGTATLGTMFTEMALSETGGESVAIADMSPPTSINITGSARDDGSTLGDVVPLTQTKEAAFGAAAAAAAVKETPVFFSSPYNTSSNSSIGIATDDSSTTLVGKKESVSLNTTATAMNVSSTSSVNVNASAISKDSIPSAITSTNTTATKTTNATAVGAHDNTTATVAWHNTANVTAENSSDALLNATDTSVHPATVQSRNATASPNSTHTSATHTTSSSWTTPQNATANAVKQDSKSDNKATANAAKQDFLKTPKKATASTPKQDLKTPKNVTANVSQQDLKTPNEATANAVKPDLKSPKKATANDPKQDLKTHKNATANAPKQDLKTPKKATANAPKQDLKTGKDSHSNITSSPLAHTSATSSSNATETSDLPGKHKKSTTDTVNSNSTTMKIQNDASVKSTSKPKVKIQNDKAVNSTSKDAAAANTKPKLRGTKPIRIPAGNVSTTALKK
jgi:hypothetical protein